MILFGTLKSSLYICNIIKQYNKMKNIASASLNGSTMYDIADTVNYWFNNEFTGFNVILIKNRLFLRVENIENLEIEKARKRFFNIFSHAVNEL